MPKPIARLPQVNGTRLSPLEEVLFQTWARAHGVHNHMDKPDSHFDYRNLFKSTNGRMHLPGQIEHTAQQVNELMGSAQENSTSLDDHVNEAQQRNQEQKQDLHEELMKRSQEVMKGMK